MILESRAIALKDRHRHVVTDWPYQRKLLYVTGRFGDRAIRGWVRRQSDDYRNEVSKRALRCVGVIGRGCLSGCRSCFRFLGQGLQMSAEQRETNSNVLTMLAFAGRFGFF